MNKTLAIAAATLLVSTASVATTNPLKAKETAIQGYDPVAYFTANKPLKGKKQYTLTWNDVTWQFSSEKNLKKFESNPKKYAAQYNGWCAYAVSSGYAAETDPINGWTLHQGKLYLNWSPAVKFLWRVRKDHHIKQANQNWPGIHKKILAGQIEISRK